MAFARFNLCSPCCCAVDLNPTINGLIGGGLTVRDSSGNFVGSCVSLSGCNISIPGPGLYYVTNEACAITTPVFFRCGASIGLNFNAVLCTVVRTFCNPNGTFEGITYDNGVPPFLLPYDLTISESGGSFVFASSVPPIGDFTCVNLPNSGIYHETIKSTNYFDEDFYLDNYCVSKNSVVTLCPKTIPFRASCCLATTTQYSVCCVAGTTVIINGQEVETDDDGFTPVVQVPVDQDFEVVFQKPNYQTQSETLNLPKCRCSGFTNKPLLVEAGHFSYPKSNCSDGIPDPIFVSFHLSDNGIIYHCDGMSFPLHRIADTLDTVNFVYNGTCTVTWEIIGYTFTTAMEIRLALFDDCVTNGSFDTPFTYCASVSVQIDEDYFLFPGGFTGPNRSVEPGAPVGTCACPVLINFPGVYRVSGIPTNVMVSQ